MTTTTTHATGPEFIDVPMHGLLGAPLGLRGIRFDNGEGGAGAGGDAGAGAGDAGAAAAAAAAGAAAGAGAPTPADAAAAAAATAAQATDADLPDGTKFADLPATTQAEVRRLRNEARTTRERGEQQLTEAQQKQQEQLDAVAKALGLKADDKPVDPAQLQTQLAQHKTTAENSQRELAVMRNAPADVDANLLLDSRAFTDKLAGVNPGDTAAIKAAITEFVANHETRYKRPAIGGGSGTGGAGAGGDRSTKASGSMLEAVKAAGRKS